MENEFWQVDGETIPLSDLQVEKAKAVAEAIPLMNYVTLLEARRRTQDNSEVLIIEVEVELGQRLQWDIRRRERLGLVFHPDDAWVPEVLALRQDFPLVPHLNLGPQEFPRSFCLYDEPYEELRLHWTPAQFIGRIREWLSRTAHGQLHHPDQPLEPLLLTSDGDLILPESLLQDDSPFALRLRRTRGIDSSRWVLMACNAEDSKPTAFAIVLRGAPQQHGIICRSPTTLAELASFAKAAEIDLLSVLKGYLREDSALRQFRDALFITILILPKTRNPGAAPEATERWAFVVDKDVGSLGVKLGVWGIHDGQVGLILTEDATADGSDAPVFQLE